ncbi:class I SAM-dependent methyltransferase [soil metagenome]
MSTLWQRVARAGAGDDYASVYAARFRRLADEGADVDGEARFVFSLVPPPARVLDAGCGTGRIAMRLHYLGYDVVGCDVDPAMIRVAEQEAPELAWQVADLATLDLGSRHDLVLLAGNVIPLLEPGTLAGTCVRLAAHVEDGGTLLAGFGLDAEHLPAGAPVVPLDEVDDAMAAAGLAVRDRWATWDSEPFVAGGGYAITAWGSHT